MNIVSAFRAFRNGCIFQSLCGIHQIVNECSLAKNHYTGLITHSISSEKSGGGLFYHRVPEFWPKETKLDFLNDNSLNTVGWQRLVPNQKHTWLRTDTEDEFTSYLPIGSKAAKQAKSDKAETIFKTYSGGVKTNRDTYVYDFSFDRLSKRMRRFIEDYNAEVDRYRRELPKPDIDMFVDYNKIKWSATLKDNLKRHNYAVYNPSKIRVSPYRPFSNRFLFLDHVVNDRVLLQYRFLPLIQSESENQQICVSGIGSSKPLHCYIAQFIPCYDIIEKGQCFPFYTYDKDGSNRRENITDWALDQFRARYNDPAISKWDIFYYVYGLLHHPGYRERYALDLKRNLPRIPFAPTPSPGPFPEASGKGGTVASAKSLPEASGRDLGWGWQKGGFWPFSRAGQQLADLHLNYESVDRYELDWHAERTPPSYRVEKMLPKGKTDSEQGNYKVYSTLKYNDSLSLHGIPERAFAYRLGNRSALDWIVDQYRVKTDKRSGITTIPTATATTRNTS